jgi:hypothetical protein
MFCPEGYVTLTEMIAKTQTFAYEWWTERGRDLQESELEQQRQEFQKEHGTLENMMPLELDEDTPIMAYQYLALHRLAWFHANKFLMCSNQGMLMRIGSIIFDAERVSTSPFPEQLAAQERLIDFLSGSFFHIETNSGTIRPCTNQTQIDCYDLSLPIEIITPFSGWSICWKPKSFDNWPQELREMLAEGAGNHERAVTMRPARGRPKHGGGVVEIALQREFQRRRDAGDLALDQLESVYAAAAEWVQHIFGHDLPRETARRYLADILGQKTAQK